MVQWIFLQEPTSSWKQTECAYDKRRIIATASIPALHANTMYSPVLEIYAIVWTQKQKGLPHFQVFTDHKPLEAMYKMDQTLVSITFKKKLHIAISQLYGQLANHIWSQTPYPVLQHPGPFRMANPLLNISLSKKLPMLSMTLSERMYSSGPCSMLLRKMKIIKPYLYIFTSCWFITLLYIYIFMYVCYVCMYACMYIRVIPILLCSNPTPEGVVPPSSG